MQLFHSSQATNITGVEVHMSTELDVLEGCSPRTGNRDLERGS